MTNMSKQKNQLVERSAYTGHSCNFMGFFSTTPYINNYILNIINYNKSYFVLFNSTLKLTLPMVNYIINFLMYLISIA